MRNSRAWSRCSCVSQERSCPQRLGPCVTTGARGPARFGGYLDPGKFGPGLGSLRDDDSELFRRASFGAAEDTFKTVTCASCHRPNRLGSLNWPMDKTLISSFVKGGQMPLNSELRTAERARLYKRLVQDYFSVDNTRPGILKAWLLGKMR